MAVAITVSPSSSPHSAKPLLDVRMMLTVEEAGPDAACSCAGG